MKKLKLNEIATFERGLTYKKKDEVEKSKNIVLRATNIDLEKNRLNLDDLKYISDEIIINDNKIIKKNDILICTASGSKKHLGKVALIEENLKMAFGGFMGILRVKENCLGPYLFYNLISDKFKLFLGKLTDGSSINNLKFSQIESFEFIIPSINEQKKTIDKIKNLQSEIENSISLNLKSNILLSSLKLEYLNELLDKKN